MTWVAGWGSGPEPDFKLRYYQFTTMGALPVTVCYLTPDAGELSDENRQG